MRFAPTRSPVHSMCRVGTSGPRGRNTTSPSPISTRPSDSIPKLRPRVHQPRHRLAGQEGVRQGDRRLQRGHPTRPQARRRLRQPRHRLAGQEGVRQGDRRLQRGHPTRPQLRQRLRQPWQRLGRQEGVRQGDRRLQRGHPARPQARKRLRQPRLAWTAKKEYDKAIADYNEAIRLDPKDAGRISKRAVTSLITSRDNAADCRTSLELWGWRDERSPYAVLIGYFGQRRSRAGGRGAAAAR